MDWLAPLAVGIFGLLFGSFANVVIWRLPRAESLSSPGSHCPSCDESIGWRDNVPVLSWILLRGRCRGCGQPISIRYPLVELLSATLWVAMWYLYGPTLALGFAIAFAYLLMILSFIDLDTMRLPNVLVASLAVFGLVGVLISELVGVRAAPLLSGAGWLSRPWAFASAGLLIGGVVPLATSAVYASLRGGAGIGMGDVKLLGAMGLFIGPYVLMALMFGSMIGAVSAVAFRGRGGSRRKIPFGPFLAMGGIACLAWGPQMWIWYSQFL